MGKRGMRKWGGKGRGKEGEGEVFDGPELHGTLYYVNIPCLLPVRSVNRSIDLQQV